MELCQHMTHIQGADLPTPGLGRNTISRNTVICTLPPPSPCPQPCKLCSNWPHSITRQPDICQTRKLHLSSHMGNPRAADTKRVPSHTWKCADTRPQTALLPAAICAPDPGWLNRVTEGSRGVEVGVKCSRFSAVREASRESDFCCDNMCFRRR